MSNSINLRSKLAQYLYEKREDGSFVRHDVDYYNRFARLDEHLNKQIHPHVNQGATAADEQRATWLTDHGPDHIATVIRRASDLTFSPEPVLTPYEAYLLLMAAHFHDVGNIFGRRGHEKKVGEVMAALDSSLVGDDTTEQRLIAKIARSHGGYVTRDGRDDKDTIGELGYPPKPRPPRATLIAAVLRMADEFSEDRSRTNRFLQNHVPPGSAAYHKYAQHLDPIDIDIAEHIARVHFDLNATAVCKMFQKDDDEVYLIDEIFARSLKMHREHIYCSRFLEPWVHLAQISVTIDICSDDFQQVIKQIAFTMANRGYPDAPTDLTDICPSLNGVSGATIRRTLEGVPQASEAQNGDD